MAAVQFKTYYRLFFVSALFWIALGLLHLVSLWLEEPLASREAFFTKQRFTLFVSAYLCWAFLTVFLYSLIEFNPPNKNNFRWLIYLLITTFVWLALITLINQSLSLLLWGQSMRSLSELLLSMPPFLHLFNFVKILLIYSACAGIFYFQRMQETRIQLLQMEREQLEIREKQSRFQLQALHTQLSPHFLFNCLNTINGLAQMKDTPAITGAVTHLAELLRYTLEATRETRVYIAEEIRFTENYIALQKSRFEHCFEFSIENNLTNTYQHCLPFCIQTLVENIFAHNEFSSAHPIRISVRLMNDHQLLRIEVENSPRAPSTFQSTGTGLNNLRERLELVYGNEASLNTASSSEQFIATLTFPVEHEDD